MTELYSWNNYSVTANFLSGILWIPYTMFLFYLCYEHHKREKFPQNLIMLLLAIGAVFRTIWFLGYRLYQSALGFLIINRVAILLQFTALSMLILMWMRALKITQIAYSKQPSSFLPAASSFAANRSGKDSISNTNNNINSNNSSSMSLSNSPSRNSQSNHSQLQRQATLTHSSRQALMFKHVEAQFQRLVCYVSIFVAFVWLCILLSLIGDADQKRSGSRDFFNANIIMISSLCLLEAVFTLVVGVRTALALQKELAPVFVSNSAPQSQKKHNKHSALTVNSNILVRTANNNTSNNNMNNNTKLKGSGSHNDLVSLTSAHNHHPANANTGNGHDERLISQNSENGEYYYFFSVFSCSYCLECCGFQAFVSLYRLFFTRSQSALGLQLQRDVLRSLLTVSLIVFVFFFLRAFGYLFRFIDTSKTSSEANGAIGEVWYPLFFYQIPELIPTLAIAAGISPPNGILKRMLARSYAFFCCVKNSNAGLVGFSSDFSTSTATGSRRTRPPNANNRNNNSSNNNRRLQTASVASSNTYLSSLTGGAMSSVQSDHTPNSIYNSNSNQGPNSTNNSVMNNTSNKGGLETIAEHDPHVMVTASYSAETPPQLLHKTTTSNDIANNINTNGAIIVMDTSVDNSSQSHSSSLATSQQSGVSSVDRAMVLATTTAGPSYGSLQPHLQLPLHLQQQLQIQQVNNYNNQNNHQNPLIPNHHLVSSSSPAPGPSGSSPVNYPAGSTAVVRDSDVSLSTSGRLSEPSVVNERTSSTVYVPGMKPKTSFSIASSPNTHHSNGLYFRSNSHNNNSNHNNEEVLFDDVADSPDRVPPLFPIPINNNNNNTNNVSSSNQSNWSPLTGSLASSAGYQPSSLRSQQSALSRQNNNSTNNNGNVTASAAAMQQQQQTQSRSSLISLFFSRSNNYHNSYNNNVSSSSSVAASSHHTNNNHNNSVDYQDNGEDQQDDDMRQESADYAELLYRLNSYIPERLPSADALYHDLDAQHYVQSLRLASNAQTMNAIHNNDPNNMPQINSNNESDTMNMVSASEEREHALAAYLAPKSRWWRHNNNNNHYHSNNNSNSSKHNSVDSDANNYTNNTNYFGNHTTSVEYTERDEEAGQVSAATRPPPVVAGPAGKQSALSKSWLSKVLR